MSEQKLNFETLRDWIYFHFYKKAEPVFVFGDITIPAASVWLGIRAWVKFFREIGLKEGTRICIALPFDITFLFVFFAAIWESLSIFLLREDEYNENIGKELDCSLDISYVKNNHSVLIREFLPVSIESIRKTYLPPSSNVRCFLKTSGTTNKQKWIGLSEENILSVLDSHSPLLYKKDKIQISSLPWSHAFGLVLDLLLGISTSCVIIRDIHNGREIKEILSLIQTNKDVYWSTVPLSIERVIELGKEDIILKLSGGIIGGAPVTSKVSEVLSQSKLRVGYGQTEASPGITLGEIGRFFPFYLGKPVGCEVRINSDSELEFKGKNTFIAKFELSTISYYPTERWVQTGDICSEKNGEYFLLGRKDNSFKLSNGKMFIPEEWEQITQEKFPQLGEICLLDFTGKYFLFIENEEFLQEELWKKELPDLIIKNFQLIHFPKLPKYPKGGVNRKELKKFLEERF